MFYAYVLLSLKNGILYKGSTENIDKRVEEHNSGVSKYTSKHLPWKLLHFEEFETRSEALMKEKWFKTGVGRAWVKENFLKEN